MSVRHALPTLAAAAAVLALAACGTDAQSPDTSPTGTAASSAGESVVLEDGWVKSADSGMSAAFGELENTGDSDVTVVSVTSPASTAMELHETVENESGQMVMREKADGFTIPGGTSLSLEPGGNHLMLMDLVAPLRAGDEVAFTLTFSDGSTYEFTVPAKDYSGANETYEGGEHMDMGEHTETGEGEHMDMGDE
ncbi:copper chaperone PCu(A)C [Cellulomonas sp.]|uniref:copper chaperone PCu(A)C n=1 Tax=Cellulomonas sp. TaxID=40001 RepID=UPI001B25E28B|nr:copper chaperone PCu(A)C [Cellulomonas sp.]MBO9556806.1 copper chaperone PCu(A)C [Cellulomonas sp.]